MAIERLMSGFESKSVCGSEGRLCLYSPGPPSSSPDDISTCRFAWTGKTGADLRFWDMDYEYFLRPLPGGAIHTSFTLGLYREHRSGVIFRAMGMQPEASIPDALATTIDDIAAMFSREPHECHEGYDDEVGRVIDHGVCTYRPVGGGVRWRPHRIPNTNTFITYMTYDPEVNCCELERFVFSVRTKSKFHGGGDEALDWDPAEDDEEAEDDDDDDDDEPLPMAPEMMPKPSRVSQLSHQGKLPVPAQLHHHQQQQRPTAEERSDNCTFAGTYLYTIVNNHPDFARLFPKAPPGTHAIAVGRGVRLPHISTHWEGRRFYTLDSGTEEDGQGTNQDETMLNQDMSELQIS